VFIFTSGLGEGVGAN